MICHCSALTWDSRSGTVAGSPRGAGTSRGGRAAAAGDQCRGIGQLQGRGGVVALADAGDQRLARIPGRLAGPALPGLRRQQASLLAGQVDAGARTQPETAQLRMHAVDAQFHGQVVEVHIAGLRYRPKHVHAAVAVTLPAAEAMRRIAQRVPARAPHVVVGSRHPAGQSGQRHQRLDGRPGRVEPAQGAVGQGSFGIVQQATVVLAADATDEQVRIEGRLADHGQHMTADRVHRHHGARPPSQRGLRRPLQVDVQIQSQRRSGLRADAIEHAKAPTVGVHFRLLVANPALQQRIVGFLDTALAGAVGGPLLGAGLRQFGLADPTDVTDHVRGQRPCG